MKQQRRKSLIFTAGLKMVILPHKEYDFEYCEQKHVLLFMKSEFLFFKVSITNMPKIF